MKQDFIDNNDIIIRNVRREDLEDVVDIQITGWQNAYKGIIDQDYLDNMDREERLNKRLNDYQNTGFLVAEYKGEVVGFVRYIFNNEHTPNIDGVDCELLAIYVRYSKRGLGIGKKLFNKVVEEFKDANKTKMVLWCLKDNENSKVFYSKMGGKLYREKEIEIGGKNYKEICFMYVL